MATILQITNADRNLSLFCRGLKVSGLDVKLGEMGPFTILGPVNLGLRKLNSMTYDQLLEPANMNNLIFLLSCHVLVGKKMLTDFRNNQKLPTINGKEVSVSAFNGDIYVNEAKILSRDRQGSNGVVHLLDNAYTLS